jgi:hypothetical protein
MGAKLARERGWVKGNCAAGAKERQSGAEPRAGLFLTTHEIAQWGDFGVCGFG